MAQFVAALVLVPFTLFGVVIYKWQSQALDDARARDEDGIELPLGKSARYWLRRLYWSVPAVMRYHRLQGAPSLAIRDIALTYVVCVLAILGVLIASSTSHRHLIATGLGLFAVGLAIVGTMRIRRALRQARTLTDEAEGNHRRPE